MASTRIDDRERALDDLPTDAPDVPSTEDDGTPLQDWIEAENSRPTLPEETADGMDDMDEEIRHQAEDIPADDPGD